MSGRKSNHDGGIGVLGVFQIVFIVLKFVGTIEWSWWIVFTPLWIELGILAIVILILLTFSN